MKRPRSRRPLKGDSAAAVAVYEASWLRRLGVAVLCAKLASIPLVFDASLDMPFTVSKALLSHGLAWILAGVIAGLLIQFGGSLLRWSWLHVPVSAFLAVNVVATLFAADVGLALFGTHARMLGLASIADGVVLYVALVVLVRGRADASALAISALGAAAIVLVYEAVQMLGRDPFRWSGDTIARPISTLGQSTVLAQYLTTLGIGALACGLLIDRVRVSIRVLLIAYSALLVLGSVATGTRSLLIGAATGCAALVLCVWVRYPDRHARVASLVTAAASVVVLGALLVLTPLGARLAATIESPQLGADDELLDRLEPSAAGRLTLYEIGGEMIRERPILGYGPDNFTVGVPRYRPERAPEQIRQSLATSAHSWIFQVAATSGLGGLACFVAIALAAAVIALRGDLRPAALAATATLAAFLGTGLTTVNDIGTDWLFWASAGIVAATTAQASNLATKQRPSRARRPSNVRRYAPWTVVIGATFIAATGWNALDASRSARSSQDARQVGEASRAIDLGLRATRSDGGRAIYWDALGLAYISASRWQEAADAFDRARRLAPYDVRYNSDLVQALLLSTNAGDVAASSRAVQFADDGVRIDPNNPRAHLTRAVAMQVARNLPEAVRSADRALALDPGSTNGTLYITATQVTLDSGRSIDAIRIAREGLGVLGRTRSSVPLRIELARALVADGKPADALAELDTALAIQPGDAAATRLRADIQASIPR